MRSKRSRIQRGTLLRWFTIRAHETHGESLIEFASTAGEMELRSKDSVAFVYVGGELRLVQNFTINSYYALASGRTATPQQIQSSNSIVLALLGVAVLILIIVLLVGR